VGKSGERGCFQYLPSTWRLFSLEVFGEVREQTPIIERYVTIQMIRSWLERGDTPYQIALRWNAGGAARCSSGVNVWGVKYDSCSYVKMVLAHL